MADTYTRGVLTTGLGTYGKVQGVDTNEDGEEVLIKDENGITCVEDLYDEVNTVTGNLVMDRDTELPSRGDTVALSNMTKSKYNGNYTVVSVDSSEVNTDAPSGVINLRRFVDGNLPAS